MILADKIVSLRKKAGWSQEDLAEKLGVTRQSVSKWEGAQSVPDMDKVVMMSRLFGVSTDFLLKDELEEETPCAAAQDDDTPLRRVTMEQASAYLALRKAAAPKIAVATALCIISPVTLILLAGMSEVQRFHITENAASGIGLCVLLGLVALAVSIFLRTGAEAKEYRFLEEEPFETEYGVEGMVRQRQREYKDTHTRLVTVGVVLCVLAAVPLFAAMCISGSDLLYIAAVCALLVLVAIGCLALVTAGVYQAPWSSCWRRATTPAGRRSTAGCWVRCPRSTGSPPRRCSCCTPTVPAATANPGTAGSSGLRPACCTPPLWASSASSAAAAADDAPQ